MTAAIMMLLAGVSGAAAAGDEHASLSQITFHYEGFAFMDRLTLSAAICPKG